MQQTRRSAGELAETLAAAALVGTWTVVGLRVLVGDEPVSVEGLVAALACAVAGIGAGVLLAAFAARREAGRGREVPAPGSEGAALLLLLLGLVNLGVGMEPALQSTPSPWAWLSLLFPVAGGTLVGCALVLHNRQRAPRALI